MKRFILVLFLFVSCFNRLYGQFTDDFSDGDYLNNPAWTVDNAANWVIDNNRLRSNSSIQNSSFFITIPSTKVLDAQWEFQVNLQFNTSSANFVDFYLASESGTLATPANPTTTHPVSNGYFVRIGGTPDEISLYKNTGGTATLLINGVDGTTNTSNLTVLIKVTRDAIGLWNLSRDLSGTGNNFLSEGTATDNTFTTGNFFGIRVVQSTSSFFNRHFFDDFSVGELIVDTTAPAVNVLQVLSSNQLELVFSENINQSASQNPTNYLVNNNIGNPTTAQRDQTDNKKVSLTFSGAFVTGQVYVLTVQNVSDLSGNVMLAQNLDFTFIQSFTPQFNELLVSEIMADPRGNAQPLSPLPDAEYIELYNRSNQILNLQNCLLKDASAEIVLPRYLLPPKEYLLVCAQDLAGAFPNSIRILGLNNFPALTNAGERINLVNPSGKIIFTVNYKDSWYQNSSKADGGWSLEMIDANHPCGEAENWRASEDSKGGTPGRPNSIEAQKPDNKAPRLLRAEALDKQTLRLIFNEKMDENSLLNGTYALDQGVQAQIVLPEAPDFKRVILKLTPDLQRNSIYKITASGQSDCNGNILSFSEAITYGLPEPGDTGEVILNEILFNPRTGGEDFVELYNQSSKFINLKNWKVANLSNGVIANQSIFSTDDLVLSPSTYLVLSAKPDQIAFQYPSANPDVFIEILTLPSYNDDEGTFILINERSQQMERFDYQDDFHFPLLSTREGVSLERISFTLPTNNKNSWQSASAATGFATPGYRNSQQRNEGDPNKFIQIQPRVISPDGDGVQDFTSIDFAFEQGGNLVDVSIYDAQGREIKRLARGLFAGTSPLNLLWDGTDDQGAKAKVGYYMILIKIFNSNGNQQVFREKIAVGAKF